MYPYGWYITTQESETFVENIKEKNGCHTAQSVYDCFDGKTSEQVIDGTKISGKSHWRPTTDDDFFLTDLGDENYDAAKKYDFSIELPPRKDSFKDIWVTKPINIPSTTSTSSQI